ncbi:1388_t:CDS:2, partial [Gigaspora margarita]
KEEVLEKKDAELDLEDLIDNYLEVIKGWLSEPKELKSEKSYILKVNNIKDKGVSQFRRMVKLNKDDKLKERSYYLNDHGFYINLAKLKKSADTKMLYTPKSCSQKDASKEEIMVCNLDINPIKDKCPEIKDFGGLNNNQQQSQTWTLA